MNKGIVENKRLYYVKNKSRLSTILQAEATKQGLRHKDIALLTQIAQSTVSRCLSGDMPISLENAEKIAEALKLDTEWVVTLVFGETDLSTMIEKYSRYPSIVDLLHPIKRHVGVA